MEITKYRDPWTFYVIDNFLPQEEFDYIQRVTKHWPDPPSKFEKFNLRLDDFKFYEETYQYYKECLTVKKYIQKGAKNLEQYFDLSGKYKSLHLEYAACGEEFWYRIHKDAKEKIMSHVLYVSEEGDGTRLFSDVQKYDEVQVDWKPNRMISFFNGRDKFHDYYSTYEKRITFNICFIDKVIKPKQPLKRFENDLTLRAF